MREVGEGLPGRAGVPMGAVSRQEALEQALTFGKGREAFHVIRVVRTGVLRVEPDEAVGRGDCLLVIVVPVVGIDQFELRLFGVGAEGVARFQQLQVLHCQIEVSGADVFLGGLVERTFALIRRNLLVVTLEPRTAAKKQRG